MREHAQSTGESAKPQKVKDGMVTKENVLGCLRDHADDLKRRFSVKELYVFGSVARGEASETSDVDVLVDFKGKADFDRFMGLQFYLEDLLNAQVDLVTRKALRPRLRASIEKEAIHAA